MRIHSYSGAPASPVVPPDLDLELPAAMPAGTAADAVRTHPPTRFEAFSNDLLMEVFDYVDPAFVSVLPDDTGEARGVAAFTVLNRRMAHAGRYHAAAADILAQACGLASEQDCEALMEAILHLPSTLRARVLHALVELMWRSNSQIDWPMRHRIGFLLLERHHAAVQASDFLRMQLHEMARKCSNTDLEQAVGARVPLTDEERCFLSARRFTGKFEIIAAVLPRIKHLEPRAWILTIAGTCARCDADMQALSSGLRLDALFTGMDAAEQWAMSRALRRSIRNSLQRQRAASFEALLLLHEKMPAADRPRHEQRLSATACHVNGGAALLAWHRARRMADTVAAAASPPTETETPPWPIPSWPHRQPSPSPRSPPPTA